MSAESFLEILTSKTWRSDGSNTVENVQYNANVIEWQKRLIEKNLDYYPPEGVKIKVIPHDIVRPAYSVPHHGHDVKVPATVIKTFRREITGTDFSGKELLAGARYTVKGDHAVSSPMVINNSLGLTISVSLTTLESGKIVMVNELMWSAQHENDTSKEPFYDVQKWYCCGYP